MSNKELMDHILPGIQSHLESCPGYVNFKFITKHPVDIDLPLSQDLVDFYHMSNGFEFEWNISLLDSVTSMGKMVLSSIDQVKLVTVENVEYYQLSENEYGSVLSKHDSSIWFYTMRGNMIYLAESWTNYFRLMYAFLGIHGWQLGFSEEGWPTRIRDWIYFYTFDFGRKLDQHRARSILYKSSKTSIEKKKAWIDLGIPSDSDNWWSNTKIEVKAFNREKMLKLVDHLSTTKRKSVVNK